MVYVGKYLCIYCKKINILTFFLKILKSDSEYIESNHIPITAYN